MNRIDLRGQALDLATCAPCCPRAEFDVEAALAAVRPIVERVRIAAPAALRELGLEFDGVRPDRLRVPAERPRGGARRTGPGRAVGAGGVDPPGPAGAPRPAPARHDDPGRPRRQRHRALGAGRAGRAVRARRPGRLSDQRGDERRAGPGGRRRVDGCRVAAATGQRTSSAGCRNPTDPRRLRAARRGRGLRRRRRAGDRDVRLRRSRDRRARRWRMVCAPVDLVTGPGNIYVAAAKRAAQGR